MRIVNIHDGGPTDRHTGEQFTFCFRNKVNTSEKFSMRQLHIGDKSDVRLGDGAEIGHFAGMVNSHFNYSIIRGVIHFKQSERNPDMIIQISFGLVDIPDLGQNESGHLLNGCFAVRSADADYRLLFQIPVHIGVLTEK